MGKSRKDAVGGHFVRDPFYDRDGWKRLPKDRANRMLRRQHCVIAAQAVLDYEDEMAETARMLEEWDSYYDDYLVYLDELEREELDRERDEQYDQEMRYEAEREFESFVYERDIANPPSYNFDYDFDFNDF